MSRALRWGFGAFPHRPDCRTLRVPLLLCWQKQLQPRASATPRRAVSPLRAERGTTDSSTSHSRRRLSAAARPTAPIQQPVRSSPPALLPEERPHLLPRSATQQTRRPAGCAGSLPGSSCAGFYRRAAEVGRAAGAYLGRSARSQHAGDYDPTDGAEIPISGGSGSGSSSNPRLPSE